jgi:hypothetical protein
VALGLDVLLNALHDVLDDPTAMQTRTMAGNRRA